MSHADSTSVAEAISFTPTADQNVPYCAQSDTWLCLAGLTRARYDEEMDVAMECFDGHIHPVFEMLNTLPESPDVKILKSELNGILRAPYTKPQNPVTLLLRVCRTLVDVIAYYDSRGKRTKHIKIVEAPGDIEGLKEIEPQNIAQKRAMVLLMLLKANPKEAMHTEDCKLILEGSEGSVLDPTVVRRAMCVLAEIYGPKIVYEKVDGSYRVRANF